MTTKHNLPVIMPCFVCSRDLWLYPPTYELMCPHDLSLNKYRGEMRLIRTLAFRFAKVLMLAGAALREWSSK